MSTEEGQSHGQKGGTTVKFEEEKMFFFVFYLNKTKHIHLPSGYIPIIVPVMATS